MRQGPDGSTWRTSFPHDPDIITLDYSVVTVMSGSRGTGGHASMFLEHMKQMVGLPPQPETLAVDLGTSGGGSVNVNVLPVQRMLGSHLVNFGMPKDGKLEDLARSHHHSYSLNPQQKSNFLSAVARFKAKNDAGRYRYRVPGGAVGWLTSKPGTRGVNCADFVIKILTEAGIETMRHRIYDLPKRVAD